MRAGQRQPRQGASAWESGGGMVVAGEQQWKEAVNLVIAAHPCYGGTGFTRARTGTDKWLRGFALLWRSRVR